MTCRWLLRLDDYATVGGLLLVMSTHLCTR